MKRKHACKTILKTNIRLYDYTIIREKDNLKTTGRFNQHNIMVYKIRSYLIKLIMITYKNYFREEKYKISNVRVYMFLSRN